MSSFFPLISELLPMIMPASTHIVRAKDLQPSHPTVEGPAVQRSVMVGRSDKMCTSVLTIYPRFSTTIRHNSEQDAIMYLVSGHSEVLVKEGFEDKTQSHHLSQGDSIFIPAWTEHQVRNDSEDTATWLVVQSGPRPAGADLTDWGGDEADTRG